MGETAMRELSYSTSITSVPEHSCQQPSATESWQPVRGIYRNLIGLSQSVLFLMLLSIAGIGFLLCSILVNRVADELESDGELTNSC
ncbi:hypothetical protein [Roseofilum casamattae]|uniref:Uncharacterized protein n=1 Tax=Roseofilum casamattae BLCC-M143 TaxID=3022442 RepID=A0ABT7C0B4_9CYAN|nr:hypothetical protein [Roseofilum casamattae]MDJ1184893.1 hypothetical protein [Roseofilum casamattae BLCC-M143]